MRWYSCLAQNILCWNLTGQQTVQKHTSFLCLEMDSSLSDVWVEQMHLCIWPTSTSSLMSQVLLMPFCIHLLIHLVTVTHLFCKFYSLLLWAEVKISEFSTTFTFNLKNSKYSICRCPLYLLERWCTIWGKK